MRVAVDMVEERLITKQEALRRIEPDQLNQLLRPIFDQQKRLWRHTEGRLLGTRFAGRPRRGDRSNRVSRRGCRSMEKTR